MLLRTHPAAAVTGLLASLLIAATTDAAAQAAPAALQAETVLYNGKIVTADRSFNIAQAVAIRDEG